jgi:hypothetical protein
MDSLTNLSPAQLAPQELIRIYLPYGRGMHFSICLALLIHSVRYLVMDVLANYRRKKSNIYSLLRPIPYLVTSVKVGTLDSFRCRGPRLAR